MLEFYESCTELCLSRNTRIHSSGWKTLFRLLRKLPSLRWLDLRGVKLNNPDVALLAHAIRSQAMSCRADVSRYLKFRLANKQLLAKQESSESTEVSNQSNSDEVRAATCAQHGTTLCTKCLSELPYVGLRGLHLGGCGLRQLTWDTLINSIRLSSVCDVRLPENQLGPQEALMLTPLIRYGASLRYLDLSKNHIGSEGCAYIASAIASTAFSSRASKSSGLRRLDLSENELDASSMTKLASALANCRNLTCLQLSGNQKLGCTGIINLQPGLLSSRNLSHLGLASCRIECVGAVALAEVLVDKPRRLRVINLRWNNVGAAGLLALARCLQCMDRRVRIDGLDHSVDDRPSLLGSDKIFHSAARLAGGTSPQTPQSVDPILIEARANFRLVQDSNLQLFPKTSSVSTRYCDIICPTNFGNRRDSVDEVDPRYIWGDSSDDENDGKDSDVIELADAGGSMVEVQGTESDHQASDNSINNSPPHHSASSELNGKWFDRTFTQEDEHSVSEPDLPGGSEGSKAHNPKENHWTNSTFGEPFNSMEMELGNFVPIPLH